MSTILQIALRTGRTAAVGLVLCMIAACANRATPEQLASIRTIAVAVDLDQTVYRQSLGMMIFSNDFSEYDAHGWKLQKLVADETVRQLAGHYATVPVEVEPWREKDDKTRGRRDYVSPLPARARQAAAQAGTPLDAVLFIATDSIDKVASSNADAPAFSLYSRNASGMASFFDDSKHIWAMVSLRAELFDLRTGQVIDYCWVGGWKDNGTAEHLSPDLYKDTMQDYTPQQIEQIRAVFEAMAIRATAAVLACSLRPGQAQLSG